MEFTEYVGARRTSLVRATVLLGCPPSDAEDIVQSALVKAHHSWRRVRREDVPPDAAVYAILLGVWREARTHRWQGQVPPTELPDPPHIAVETDETIGLGVRRALADLTPEHREVLVLRYYADLSERETATVLRLKRSIVESRTSQALAALSAALDRAAEEHRDAH